MLTNPAYPRLVAPTKYWTYNAMVNHVLLYNRIHRLSLDKNTTKLGASLHHIIQVNILI